MLLLKAKKPSSLTGRNVRLPNLLISSCKRCLAIVVAIAGEVLFCL